ncbi:hypothetical protein JD844_002746, partial [Phrynosoma platyrhinos]
EDLRVDGRSCEDYRCIEVETDVVSNTSGSARVKVTSVNLAEFAFTMHVLNWTHSCTNTSDMAMTILKSAAVFWCSRSMNIAVNLTHRSANATPEFEGRGGEELGTEIANTLYRIFHNESSIDLKLLCISPREHCWVLYVDVLVSKITLSLI